jgi:hypothetical protein
MVGFRLHSGRSAFAPGTALHAPEPTFTATLTDHPAD